MSGTIFYIGKLNPFYHETESIQLNHSGPKRIDMRKKYFILITIGLGIMGCKRNSKAEIVSSQIPMEYKSVLDSIKERGKKDRLFNCNYFLYDISGDSIPELWTYIGKSEADTRLKTYTILNGKAQLIYDGAGNHISHFICNTQLIGVINIIEEGVMITYDYDGKQVTESTVEFSTWNDEGIALSKPHDSIADEMLNCWQNDNIKHIEFKAIY